MSYDPTEWASQPPGQQPSQPPVTPPAYGQAPQPPVPPAYGQPSQPQYPSVPPTAYGQPPQAPSPYGQQPSNPGLPPQAPPPYGGSPSNPGLPPYGQQPSNPGLPSYGAPTDQYGQPSNPGLPQYGAPADPYAQQQPAWGAPVPPGYVPPAAPQKKSGAKLWIIILVIVIVLAGGGGGAFAVYQSTRPKPVITMTSQYMDGATVVGATSTSFTVKGTDFTASSAISFLLDNAAVPGATATQSDSNGEVSATLTVTDAWSVGNHTITAKDAAGYLTKLGVKVEIVTPGQSKTPGPNGAPTDSASMTIVAAATAGSSSGTYTLLVTGGATGGTVCRAVDDGQPQKRTGTSSGVAYTETTVSTCSGTYKGGKVDYTETVTTDKIVFANGLTCTARTPYTGAHLQGTFTSASAVSGSYNDDSFVIDCNLGVGSDTVAANTGTWTGVAAVQ